MAASGVTPSEFHNFIEGQGKSGQPSMRTLQEGSIYIAITRQFPNIFCSAFVFVAIFVFLPLKMIPNVSGVEWSVEGMGVLVV